MKVTTHTTKEDEVDKTNSVEDLKELAKSYQKRAKRLKLQRKLLLWILFLIFYTGLIFGLAHITTGALTDWFIQQTPTIYVKRAQAAEIEQPKFPNIGDCEQYRPIVEKYFGALTNEALFVAKMESGCIADRVSEPNRDGTRDFCLFQINREKLTAQSLDVCVRRAFEKYTAGRVGEKNWSAFYAVCDVNAQPKYPKVIKNCN